MLHIVRGNVYLLQGAMHVNVSSKENTGMYYVQVFIFMNASVCVPSYKLGNLHHLALQYTVLHHRK